MRAMPVSPQIHVGEGEGHPFLGRAGCAGGCLLAVWPLACDGAGAVDAGVRVGRARVASGDAEDAGGGDERGVVGLEALGDEAVAEA